MTDRHQKIPPLSGSVTFLNNPCIKEEITKETGKHPALNENKTMGHRARFLPSREHLALSVNMRKDQGLNSVI